MRKLSFNSQFLLLLLLLSAGIIFRAPQPAAARPAAFYKKSLTPAEFHLLSAIMELNRRGEYVKALRKFNEFKKGRSSKKVLSPLLSFVGANLNFQLANYPAAVSLYEQVLKQAPEFYLVYENYGMALLQTEDYTAAGRILLQVAEILPQKGRQLKYRAAIAFLYGDDPKKARDLLQELIYSANLESPLPAPTPPAEWLKALLQVDWQLKDYKAAVAVAEKLVDSYPEELTFWRLYGQVTLAAAEYQKALGAYKVLQAEGELTVKELKLVAGIYQRLDLHREATEMLVKALVGAEPPAADLRRLVALYRQIGETDKALSALSHLQKIYHDPMNIFQQGEILYSAGRYREAARVFHSLEKIPEKDGRQYILAGYCAWNLDDFTAAAAAWQKAATYPAWQKPALDLLKTLKPWLAFVEDKHS